MVKLKWLKEWRIRKPGDISNVAKKSAENFISQGYAEYLEEPKKKKTEKVVKKKTTEKKQREDEPELNYDQEQGIK